jgi:hypothetical protein
MVYRYIEESLQLLGVQVDGQNAVGACGGDDVCDELCSYRNAAFVLAVLPGVTEIRNDGCNALGTRAFQAIQVN